MKTRKLASAAVLLAALASVATASAAAAKGHGGKPTVERSATEVTFFDDFILDICDFSTNTTLTQRVVTKTYPDGF